MCGVIGIISKSGNVSSELFLGLQQLQHRGYQAAGMLTIDDKAHIVKGPGLVSDVFDNISLDNLTGQMGIGHVRYATTIDKKEAQPFFTDMGGMGLAYNGHIINSKEIRKKLESKGVYFESNGCDAEEMLKLFAHSYLENNKQMVSSLEKIMDNLVGSYSVVQAIKNKGLLAYKDPFGIKPLCFGEKYLEGELISYGFSSESVALEQIGYKNIQELISGTAIFIEPDLKKNIIYVCPKESRLCEFEFIYFARASSTINGISVDETRYKLGEELAKVFLQKYPNLEKNDTVVIPVPETSYPVALSFAKYTGIDFEMGFEKTRSAGRLFLKANQKLRESATFSSMVALKRALQNKNAIIIDDSIVRGTTSKRIINLAKQGGAKRIYFCSAHPMIKYPCYYGIDTPTKEELIASNKTEEEISKEIGAPVIYNTLDGLVNAIGLPKDKLCLACINGDYPTCTKTCKIKGACK